MIFRPLNLVFFTMFFSFSIIGKALAAPSPSIQIEKESKIVIVGNNLCSRMMNFGYFETEIHLRYPKNKLAIRNMCDGGNSPGFRPHAGRYSPWAFPRAEEYNVEFQRNSDSQGHFETPDEWLFRLKADFILAFFGYNESFRKEAGIKIFEDELGAFIQHTLSKRYNGKTAPQLVIISPIAFQNLSHKHDLPDGRNENKYLKIYTEVMKRTSEKYDVRFVDLFAPSKEWFQEKKDLTVDGFQLNDEGYRRLSRYLAEELFTKRDRKALKHEILVRESVLEKNWMWHHDFKIPNGVHVFGRRYEPYGPDNYPAELNKIREMTTIRDKAIWRALRGNQTDLAKLDKTTAPLPLVETNFNSNEKPDITVNAEEKSIYQLPDDALNSFTMAPGYLLLNMISQIWQILFNYPSITKVAYG